MATTTPSTGKYSSSGSGSTSVQFCTSRPATSTSDTELTDSDVLVVKRRRSDADYDESIGSQIYMGVIWSSGKIGMAYYDVDTTEMFVMNDVAEAHDFHILKQLQHQVQPLCVVTSSKQDEQVIKTIQDFTGADDEGGSLDEYLHFLPSIDFSFDICKRRIMSINLSSIPTHYNESERSLYLSSLLPFDSHNMIRALGGLLKFIEKRRIGIELEDSDASVPILKINTFSLQHLMVIDSNTLNALQIFQRENHPSVYKAGGTNNTKEGLSLFGIMNHCKSQIGTKMLRQWFLQPLRDVAALKERLEAVAFFYHSSNQEVVANLRNCLKSIKYVPRILNRMRQAQASMGDWNALYKTAYNAIYIADICRLQKSRIPIFSKISETFDDDLHIIANMITKFVDFDESASQGRFVVKPNVDAVLDEKKRTYNGLPHFMTQIAKEEMDKLGDVISECNVTYIPQLGYLLATPITQAMEESGNYEIDGLDFVFCSNRMVHYKSEKTKGLDQLLGDTQCEITDQETAIMHELQNKILEHSQVLVNIMQYAAQLDCLISLAVAAKESGYNKPRLVQESIIDIQNGRHPLQELCCSPFVPNHTQSGGECTKMKLLTGPNASGKSIYLKQVALIVYMAHIGSFVPADNAVIGMVDGIYTRIRTMDSVSVGLSTFMIDLNEVSTAVRCSTSQSLIILDEFGKGTTTVDGLSLFCGCFKHWISQGQNCPHVFASTHFHSVIQQQLLPQSPQLMYQTMEVIHNNDELVFLYQLIEGSTNTSYACHIAATAGLREEVIARGQEVSDLLRRNQQVHRVDRADTNTRLEKCKSLVATFLKFDTEKGNLEDFLKDCVAAGQQGKIILRKS